MQSNSVDDPAKNKILQMTWPKIHKYDAGSE
jgi:hypothetical protein